MEQSYLLIGLAALLVFLAAWSWIIVSIWKINPAGAVLAFFIGFPALYYLFKYWNDDELNIRAPFFTSLAVNIAVFVLAISVIVYQSKTHAKKLEAENPKLSGSDLVLERWCREKNDAVYSPGLGTCIEAEPGARRGTQKTGPAANKQTR